MPNAHLPTERPFACRCGNIRGEMRRDDGWLYCGNCKGRIGCASDADRRQSSPEYREEVHQAAMYELSVAEQDYDAAADTAEWKAERAGEWYGTESRTYRVRRDVATLLTRRALTVAGVPGGES